MYSMGMRNKFSKTLDFTADQNMSAASDLGPHVMSSWLPKHTNRRPGVRFYVPKGLTLRTTAECKRKC